MKVLIQGYSGKTGSEIYHLFLEKGVSVLGADKEKDISNFFNEEVGFIIDFSSLEGTKKAVEMALEKRIPLLIGTTGLKEEEIQTWDQKAKEKKIPIVILENYLLSMSYLKAFLKKLAPIFPSIKIEETHHISKKDAPSGTALFLKDSFPSSQDIEVISHRVNEYQYEHSILLRNENEELEIIHHTFHKKAYAEGVYEVFLSFDQYRNTYGVIRERK